MAKLYLILEFSEDKKNIECACSIEVDKIESDKVLFSIPTHIKGEDPWDVIGEKIESIVKDSPFKSYFGN